MRLPIEIEPALSAAAIAEMEGLRRAGLLSELRGGRATDLPRPLSGDARSRVADSCPALRRLLGRVERALAGTHLFVRAVKLDEARASTTRPDDDRAAPHFHFDAGESSLEEYDEPVYQLYANVASLPRQFRLLPVPLGEMIAALGSSGGLAPGEARRVRANEILARFRAVFDVPEEIVPVPTACAAIFDGRRFAHDAGKGEVEALLAGRFEPAAEPDLVLALDTVTSGHHRGLYDPALPLLG